MKIGLGLPLHTSVWMNTIKLYTAPQGLPPPPHLLGKNIQIIPKELEIEIHIKNDREKAYQNSIKSYAYNKQNYNKHRKNINLKVGDLVYIDRGNKVNRGKLEQIRIGPISVLQNKIIRWKIPETTISVNLSLLVMTRTREYPSFQWDTEVSTQ